jgi:hypothetical protein
MTDRELIRHFIASIAYHATKAITNAPENYPELELGYGVRTPRQILHHMIGVLAYANSFYEKYETTHFPHKDWIGEVKHFYENLEKLDRSVKEVNPVGVSLEQMLQGPLSDAMAHTGQLLMIRRIAGSPVPAENFIYADIQKGIVGPNQPKPVAPD